MINYPPSLPPFPLNNTIIKQTPAFRLFKTAARMVKIIPTTKNPPLEYTAKIKLYGQNQIAKFNSWFIKDTLNGALRFSADIYLPANSEGVTTCHCQFAKTPTFAEIGTHANRIKEITLKFYVYNPIHKTDATAVGKYPNIPAPITRSISESKAPLVVSGIQKYDQQLSIGVMASADTYTLIILMNYNEFQVFDAWWSGSQQDGAVGFNAPLLTDLGLKSVMVRPLSGFSAICNAGDVEVSLQVELTRPLLKNIWDELIADFELNNHNLQELSDRADDVWSKMAGGSVINKSRKKQ